MVELNLRLAGAMIVLLALSHVFFPRWFRWREEMAEPTFLNRLNRQIHLLHLSFIALVLAMIGMLALVFGPVLLDPTPLARLVAAGLTLFWFARLVAQAAMVEPALWRGDRLRTAAHAGALALWGYFSLTFGAVLARLLVG